MAATNKQLEHLEKLKVFNTNKPKSEKTKQLMSFAKLGKKFSKEHKENLSLAHQKEIFQFDSQGNLINKFESITAAAKNLNLSIAAISFALRKGTKSGNFCWRHTDGFSF